MGCLDARVVIVTGGGRGIGRAEALLFAREGAAVVVNDLGCDREGHDPDPSVAQRVTDEIRAAGGRAVASTHDVAAPGTATKLVDLAMEHFGRLDAAVASAGIGLDRQVLNLDMDDLDRVLSVHVRASFALTRAAARAFLDTHRGGAIVLTAGPGAYFGSARHAALAAAHGAIIGLTLSSALELRRHGVRVNAIVPNAHTRATGHPPASSGIDIGSMGPGHVAPVAAFLASDLAAGVHGEVIGVAGRRIYAVRGRETKGAFTVGRDFTPETVQEAWAEITVGH